MKIRKLLTIPGLVAIATIPAISIVGCANPEVKPEEIKIQSVVLSSVVSSPEVYTSIQIQAKITPENATNKELTWNVDNPNIATIDNNGVLTVLAPGNIEISAETKDGTEIKATLSLTTAAAETSAETSYEDYIYRRTFSLIDVVITDAESHGIISYGTGWILSDATPDDATDYVYYIATNWHVIKGEEDAEAQAYQGKHSMRFGCTKDTTTGARYQDSVSFKTYDKIDQSKFTYDNKSTITTTQSGVTKTGLKGVDAYIVKADFGNCASGSQTSQPAATEAKTKLDYLNTTYTANHKKITTLSPLATDAQHFENKKLYTGGYPVDNTAKVPKWEHHDLSQTQQTYYGTSAVPLTYKKQGETTHWSDSHTSPQTDCSPQYAYTGYDYFKNWMCGGASGSSLIANFGTDSAPIWRVVGIYWGGMGFEEDDNEYIRPYYSIFKSNWKNYFAEWE